MGCTDPPLQFNPWILRSSEGPTFPSSPRARGHLPPLPFQRRKHRAEQHELGMNTVDLERKVEFGVSQDAHHGQPDQQEEFGRSRNAVAEERHQPDDLHTKELPIPRPFNTNIYNFKTACTDFLLLF